MILKLKFNNKLHFQCYFDHKHFPFFSLNRQISVQSTQLSERSLLFICIYVYTELSITYAVYYTHTHMHTHTNTHSISKLTYLLTTDITYYYYRYIVILYISYFVRLLCYPTAKTGCIIFYTRLATFE